MKAGRRHAEHARHHGNRKDGLVRAHEFEDPGGIAPVSRANQAAAPERMKGSTKPGQLQLQSPSKGPYRGQVSQIGLEREKTGMCQACDTELPTTDRNAQRNGWK